MDLTNIVVYLPENVSDEMSFLRRFPMHTGEGEARGLGRVRVASREEDDPTDGELEGFACGGRGRRRRGRRILLFLTVRCTCTADVDPTLGGFRHAQSHNAIRMALVGIPDLGLETGEIFLTIM